MKKSNNLVVVFVFNPIVIKSNCYGPLLLDYDSRMAHFALLLLLLRALVMIHMASSSPVYIKNPFYLLFTENGFVLLLLLLLL